MELGYIRYPLLVEPGRAEVTLQHIWSDCPNFALVRVELLYPNQRLETHVVHQPLDSLVVDNYFIVVKESLCYSPVTVTPLVLVVDGEYLPFDASPLVRLAGLGEIVIEGRSSHLHLLEHNVKRIAFKP